MHKPKNFRFSQSNLQDYVLCPKRFNLRYLQQISWPAEETAYDQKYEHRQQLGIRFHLLIQRHIAGLSPAEIEQNITDPLLLTWWQNFTSIFQNKFETGQTFSEYSLLGTIDHSPTIAKFDLVHIQQTDAHPTLTIYDWKTNQNPPRHDRLAQKIQTRLYRYLLSKNTPVLTGQKIPPQNITMVYWFAEYPTQNFTFTYSEEQQRTDEIFLTDLIQTIKQTPSNNFVETTNKKLCTFCPYRSYCEKPNHVGTIDELEEAFNLDAEDLNLDFSFDDIDEVFYE